MKEYLENKRDACISEWKLAQMLGQKKKIGYWQGRHEAFQEALDFLNASKEEGK